MGVRRKPSYCPHCAQPLQSLRYGVPFGPTAASIIDTVERAGSRGVSTADLFTAIYGKRRGATVERLRSYVSAINRALARNDSGVAIHNSHGRHAYRVVSTRRLRA